MKAETLPAQTQCLKINTKRLNLSTPRTTVVETEFESDQANVATLEEEEALLEIAELLSWAGAERPGAHCLRP